MTSINSSEVQCSKCGHIFSTIIYSTVNVSLSPELKDDLLAGKLSNLTCPKCNAMSEIGNVILYHDMDNGIMIYVLFLKKYSNNKEEAIKEFSEIMQSVVSETGGIVRRGFEAYKFDVVFNINELKESLYGMEGSCSEKINTITKNVLESVIERDENEEDLSLSKVFVVIAGEKIDLRYYPNTAMMLRVDPKMEGFIHTIMSASKVSPEIAIQYLEEQSKAIADKIKMTGNDI